MGLLDAIDRVLGTRIGLLVSDPRAAVNALESDARAFNQASLLATQAERNAARGLPVSPEQLAAKQYIDRKNEEMALGFAGQVIPTRQAALDIASKNAEKMLGLPKGNTAMDRAKAMGFDTDIYHATGVEFDNLAVNPYRGSVFVGASPDKALSGAKAGVGDRFGSGAPDRILPLLTKSYDIKGLSLNKTQRDWFAKLPTKATESQVEDLMKKAPKDSGYWMQWFDEVQNPNGTFTYIKKPEIKQTYEQAVKTGRDLFGRRFSDYSNASNERFSAEMARNDGFKGYLQNDEAGLSMAISDPSIIRSRFAAFDPARINETDLLAAGIPFGLLAGTNIEMPKKKEKKK